jgi:hypothetical protein
MSYLEAKRSGRNAGYKSYGSQKNGTDGAHKLSHEVAAGVLKHSRGRGGHGTTKGKGADSVSRTLNEKSNIRVKSEHGNRTLDRRRDERIISAHASGSSLKEKTTADRAYQAYKGGLSVAGHSKAVDQVTRHLGRMTYNDGKAGRPVQIRNLHK